MFLTKRFYLVCIVLILLLGTGYLATSLLLVAQVGMLVLLIAVLFDIWRLYWRSSVKGFRSCSGRFSNGDDNPVKIYVENHYPFAVNLEVIDEIPAVFQRRDVSFHLSLDADESKTIEYSLCPVKRGEYSFGVIRVFASTSLGLVSRRYSCGTPVSVKVYPSYLMLHEYELMAMSNNLTEMGLKKVRQIGHHTEFEQIKEYVKGDDYRSINWKATARRHQLMVNIFQNERSQHIYNVIDKGRVMQSAFQGMTLLDYAINASLVLSYIAIHKDDKAGLITFEEQFDSFLPASKKEGQMQQILNNLYNQSTTFGESDYSSLYIHLNKHISKRSLLIIYTNFDSIIGMERQLSYLRQLARQHLVLVVFFENAELKAFIEKNPRTTEDYYQQTIAEKFAFEKALVVSTLKQHAVYSLLTTPDKLSVDVINKYLEIKSRHLI
ncbi:DUF58 domain-containing protein [uncultured Bacteroides sp.]|uniref:DUF58 domain-containing protein n=1 Tax=uncultured Bacteroides sp. TaxID=162156 RepID=UPI002AAB0626|nr:DUF58 domain-containing protein [uncultured Bacteroides sp.]